MAATPLEIRLMTFMLQGGNDRERNALLQDIKAVKDLNALKKLLEKAFIEILKAGPNGESAADRLFPNSPNKAQLFAKLKKDISYVKKRIYLWDATSGIREGQFKVPLTDVNLENAFNDILHLRFAASKLAPPPPPPPQEYDLVVNIDIDPLPPPPPPPAPAQSLWSHVLKQQSKEKAASSLISDRVRTGANPVNMADMTSRLMAKTNAKPAKQSAGNLNYTHEQNTLNIEQSGFAHKGVTAAIANGAMEVKRESHTNPAVIQDVCTLSEVPTGGGRIRLTTSADIINADNTKDYTNINEITDNMASKGVVLKTLTDLYADIESADFNLEEKFPRVSISRAGQEINNPQTPHEIQTIINAAIAIAAQRIPTFDPALQSFLDHYFTSGQGNVAGDLKNDYDLIKDIQAKGNLKTKAGFADAYSAFTDSRHCPAEFKAKRQEISKNIGM